MKIFDKITNKIFRLLKKDPINPDDYKYDCEEAMQKIKQTTFKKCLERRKRCNRLKKTIKESIKGLCFLCVIDCSALAASYVVTKIFGI